MRATVHQIVARGKERPIATFVLGADGSVLATYHEADARWDYEVSGIFTEATGRLTPADGKRFMVTLGKAHANSSRLHVRLTA